MKNEKLIAKAMDFSSFLIERIGREKIRRIILFGSAARNEAGEESDIDIFIDLVQDDKKTTDEIKKAKESFIASKKNKDYWELKGINNEFSLKIGTLDKWKTLKASIISNGLMLYGKFDILPENARNITILSFDSVRPESKRVTLSKKLFGYSQAGKKYSGLVEKYGAEKIGKGVIIVPSEQEHIFLKVFREMKINVRIMKNVMK